MIPKPGSSEKRPLVYPTRFETGWCRLLFATFWNRSSSEDFAAQSYGFRPGRGCKDALRRVDAFAACRVPLRCGCGLKSYFDTIPHDQLMRLIEQKIADSRVLGLLTAYLKQQVMDTAKDWTPEQGTPQGRSSVHCSRTFTWTLWTI